tara:strand:- start:439 stop:606 length:168 start_codon:yes stop_codon:yes gene_type:complete
LVRVVLVLPLRHQDQKELELLVVIAYLMMSPCWVAVAVAEWAIMALPVDLVVAEA